MPQISVKNLTVNYSAKHKGKTLALQNVDIDFVDKGINVVVGYSGCGKTTLLKAIIGLLPYDGQILFDGQDICNVQIPKRNLSFVSQEYVLYPHLTVFDNIAFPLKNSGATRDEIVRRVSQIAQDLQLTACLSRKPKYISGGQQQRVALARALVKQANLVLLDEPLSNVAADQRTEARQMIKNVIKRYGMTAIYVTHDIGEALALADYMVVMEDCIVVNQGRPADVYNNTDSNLIKAYKEYQQQWNDSISTTK